MYILFAMVIGVLYILCGKIIGVGESPTLVPLQILHSAQLIILYCPNIKWHFVPCHKLILTLVQNFTHDEFK